MIGCYGEAIPVVSSRIVRSPSRPLQGEAGGQGVARQLLMFHHQPRTDLMIEQHFIKERHTTSTLSK